MPKNPGLRMGIKNTAEGSGDYGLCSRSVVPRSVKNGGEGGGSDFAALLNGPTSFEAKNHNKYWKYCSH